MQMHLAFSLFPGCISSVYILYISRRILPTCIGSFHVFFICQMCPFPSCICSFYVSSICNFCLFSTCILLSHFFCNCHVCLFQICIFQFHCLHCFSVFFQDVNILEQAQFDSTNVQTPCKLQQLPPDLLFDTFRHIPSCAFVAFAQHRRCRGRCGATGFGSSWNWLTGIQVLLQSKDEERPKKKKKTSIFPPLN